MGVVALVAMAGARALGRAVRSKALEQAACVATLDCSAALEGTRTLPPAIAPRSGRRSAALASSVAAAASAAGSTAERIPQTRSTPLAEDIPDPFHHTSKSPHAARVLYDGADALLTRLQMIEHAKSSIDLAAYEFTADAGGRLVLQSLSNAAARGVRVRILIDRYTDKDKPIIGHELATELERGGVHVAYYNAAPWWKPFDRTRRSHRKLLIVDGDSVVTGGRNWSDIYWDLDDSSFSFMDRDVTIDGAAAQASAKSFDVQWNHAWTLDSAQTFRGVAADPNETLRARTALMPSQADAETRARIEAAARATRAQSRTATVPSVTFVSDRPGPAGPDVMQCNRALLDAISKAQKSVLIENYDYFPGAETERQIAALLKRNVSVTLVTNGRLTEGNAAVAQFSNEAQRRLVAAGGNVFVMGGWAAPDHVDPRVDPGTFWATHSKTVVVDSKEVIIGSFNLDPRSEELNAESLVVLHDAPELAGEVESSIWQRTQASWQLDDQGRTVGEPRRSFSAKTWFQWALDQVEANAKRPFKKQY